MTDLPSTGAGFSACIWVYRLGNGGSSSRGNPFDKLNNSGTAGWRFSVNDALTLTYAEARHTSAKVRTSSTTITSNAWYFLAVTVAAGTTASDVHIYKGSPGGAVAEVSYGTTTNGSGVYDTDSAVVLELGMNDSNKGTSWFNGYLAEARIFGNKILTLAEIQGIMNGTPNQPPATGYWPLYGSATAADLTTSHANGTVFGGAAGPHCPTCAPWALR